MRTGKCDNAMFNIVKGDRRVFLFAVSDARTTAGTQQLHCCKAGFKCTLVASPYREIKCICILTGTSTAVMPVLQEHGSHVKCSGTCATPSIVVLVCHKWRREELFLSKGSGSVSLSAAVRVCSIPAADVAPDFGLTGGGLSSQTMARRTEYEVYELNK